MNLLLNLKSFYIKQQIQRQCESLPHVREKGFIQLDSKAVVLKTQYIYST